MPGFAENPHWGWSGPLDLASRDENSQALGVKKMGFKKVFRLERTNVWGLIPKVKGALGEVSLAPSCPHTCLPPPV